MGNRKGFTLVEVLVAGIIASILAGIFIAFMYVHNQTMNEGVARGILQMQSEVVSATIGRAVRNASLVLASGEAWSQNQQFPHLANPVQEFTIAGPNIADTVFSIKTGSPLALYMGPAGGSSYAFKVGGDPVYLKSGSFWLSDDRKRVTGNLTYTITYRKTVYSLPQKTDVFLCRN